MVQSDSRTESMSGAACSEFTQRMRGKQEEHFPPVPRQIAEVNLIDSPMTVSTGVAKLRRGDTLGSLLSRADRGLYKAKSAGRNRVGIPGDSD